ncbi:MAG: hypothetical protein IPG27_01815 [Ottowia sp.]|jgi:hypothetical protein|nr:hypothetical protein [Ottowia sp.]MBK6748007.1 hypothetical protein [Ottowia sp.]
MVPMAFKAVAIWAAILLLAIANGALREALLIPKIGSPAGLVLSGLLLCALILAVACLSLPWLGARATAELIFVGSGWLALTVAFEFCLGLLQGKTLPAILEAYTFKGGNLWPLVLLVTALAPWIAARARGW